MFCLFLLLESLVPLSPSPGPWTPFSSLGTKDFLSTCLGIDSLSNTSAEPLLSIKIRTIRGMATEKAMAPNSSTLAWKIPGTGEPGGLQSMGSLRIRHNWMTLLSLSCIGEGNGNPCQHSCLENLRDGGAWWAAVCGVAQSWTRLKWLSSSSSRNGKTPRQKDLEPPYYLENLRFLPTLDPLPPELLYDRAGIFCLVETIVFASLLELLSLCFNMVSTVNVGTFVFLQVSIFLPLSLHLWLQKLVN